MISDIRVPASSLQAHVLGQELLVVADVALPWCHLLLVTHPDLV